MARRILRKLSRVWLFTMARTDVECARDVVGHVCERDASLTRCESGGFCWQPPDTLSHDGRRRDGLLLPIVQVAEQLSTKCLWSESVTRPKPSRLGRVADTLPGLVQDEGATAWSTSYTTGHLRQDAVAHSLFPPTRTPSLRQGLENLPLRGASTAFFGHIWPTLYPNDVRCIHETPRPKPTRL